MDSPSRRRDAYNRLMSSLTSNSVAELQASSSADGSACHAPRRQHFTCRKMLFAAGVLLLLLVVAFWLLPSRQWVMDAYYWIRGLSRVEGFLVFVGVYTLLSSVG